MKAITANEVKQNFGRVLEGAQREPQVIHRYNRPAAVLLSMAEYERLTAAHLENFECFCDLAAERAQEKGLDEATLAELLNDATEER